jgi:hypothetical protein
MSQNKASLKKMLEQDIRILYERFISLNLDDEERNWHLQRYFERLDTSNPDVFFHLKEILSDRITALETENEKDDKALKVYQQFLKFVNR